MADTADLDYVHLVQRIGVTVGDTPDDVDEDPDFVPATEGTVTFVPLVDYVKAQVGGRPVTIHNTAIVCSIDAQGYLSYQGTRGVWLVDLGTDKVTPAIGRETAAYRVTYKNLKFGTMTFTPDPVNINPVSGGGDVDITDLTSLPLPAGVTLAYVQSIADEAVAAKEDLLAQKGEPGGIAPLSADGFALNADGSKAGKSDADIATLATDPGTQLGAALADVTAVPTYVAPRAGAFIRPERRYIPPAADLAAIRAKVTDALAGTTRHKVAWVGHSIVQGQGGIPGQVDNVRLLAERAAQAGAATTGLVIGYNGSTTAADIRVTHDPEWFPAGSAGPRINNMQIFTRTSAAGSSWTYAATDAGTAVDIYTFGNSQAWTYSIDGGAAVPVTPSGASAVQLTTITGLPLEPHTVTITSGAANTGYVYLLGVAVRNETGLEVANFGYYGAIADDWQPASIGGIFYNGWNCVNAYDPDLVIVELAANELIHGTGTASLDTNLRAICQAVRDSGRDLALVVDPPIESDTVTTWFTDFYPVIYDVADAFAAPLVDFTAQWIRRAVADAQGFYSDQWHPNSTGYWDLHSLMAKALL